MGTTADKLNKLLETKQAIKQAIINKGVEVADDTKFADYPSKINSIPMEGGDPYYEDLYNMRTNNGTNMSYLFQSCKTPELNLSNLNTSEVTDMSYMFSNCNSQIKLSDWDMSKVVNTSYMFQSFTNKNQYLDLSILDFGNVTNTNSMFYDCDIDYVDIRNCNFDFSKITNLQYMLRCKGTELDLSNWDITGITDMKYMIYYCQCKKIDLTNWVTTSVTNMNNMINNCSYLEELIIPDWDMTNVTSTSNTFSGCSKLRYIDVSRCNATTITKLASLIPTKTQVAYGTIIVPADLSQEAYDALVAKYWTPIGAALTPAPTSIEIVAELDEIYPGKSTKVYFGSCEPWNADPSKVELVMISDSSIATIDEDNRVISTGVIGDIVLEARIIDTQEVISTKTITVSETDSYPNLVKFRVASTPSSYSTLITVNDSSKKLSNLSYDSVTDIYSYDNGAPITSIKFSENSNIDELVKLDTSNMTSTNAMFQSCKLTSLDLSSFDTSKVTDMGYMFDRCTQLTSLDLSNFDASNVTDMRSMFGICTALTTLRLDNCNNTTIKKMINSMYFPTNAIEGVTRTIYCKEENAAGLTPPTNWVFSYVTEEEPEVPVNPPAGDIPLYEHGQFYGNTELTEVRTMVTSEHDNLDSMFAMCENLVSVNTQDWDTSNVYEMYYMFAHCKSLTALNLSNWVTDKVTRMAEMFMLCWNLTELDLSNFNTSNVTSVAWMFYNCQRLESLDLSNFNLENLTGDANNPMGTENMFNSCTALTTLRLDNCSYDTISKIINSTGFPIYNYGTIYCKAANQPNTLPEGFNWTFSYVE